MRDDIEINILYQTDNNYAPYTGISINSLLRRHEKYKSINIYIIDNGIDNINKERICDTVKKYNRNVYYIDARELVKYIKMYNMPKYRGGYTNYLKMFAGVYFSENNINIERLLFIDSDSLVLGDLGELFTMNMGDNIIGMVCDSLTYRFKNKYIGLEEEDPYFNAGMVLYDMNKWLNEKALDKIKKHIQNIRASYVNHEQDILSSIFKGRILKMNPKYNFQPYHYIYDPETFLNIYKIKNYYTSSILKEAKEDIRIFHTYRFIGVFPWDDNDIHPANKLFDEELKYTFWADFTKKKKELPMYIKIERILYKILPSKEYLRIFMVINYIINERKNKKSYIESRK